jgi:hypothetical protein
MWDLSYVDRNSSAYARFKSYVDGAVANPSNLPYNFSATDAVFMYKIAGGSQYRDLAVSIVEKQVTRAEAAIASGQNPEVAGDSYLGIGGMIGDLGLVYAWCNDALTASQKTRWAAYANQAIYNIRHYSQASWGGRPAPWTGWAVNDPANNYYYSFLRAMEFWGLASNDTELLSYLTNDRWPLVVNFYATIPGGGSLEGSGYGVSHRSLFELYQVWRDSGRGDYANANTHLTNSINVWVHSTVPTLNKFHPSGDQSRVSEPAIYDYQRTLVLEAYHQTNNGMIAENGAWWLARISDQNMESGFNYRFNLIPVSSVQVQPPLTYRAAETGFTFARTSWQPDAMWFASIMGLLDQSHAHQEQGSFTLYKGTWLAVTNNIWSHSGINQSTIDNNVVRFERSSGVVPQRLGHAVDVTSYTTSANGDTHLVGNVTPMYSSGIAWTRTMDFVSGVLTVNDALMLDSSTTAIFQAQVPVQPVISGNVITAGNLRMEVQVPASPQITLVNMHNLNSDYNTGWRIDVRGATTAYRVVFQAN